MLIISSLCPSLYFFTKGNDREKKRKEKKREKIYMTISQPVE